MKKGEGGCMVKGIKKETLKHVQAFELYYSLGDDRTLDMVASKLGVSRSTIMKWSATFSWSARVIERDKRIADKLRTDTERSILKDQVKYRRIISKAVDEFEKALDDKKVKITTVKDFAKLIDSDIKVIESIRADKEQGATVSTETSETLAQLNKELENVTEPEDLEPEED